MLMLVKRHTIDSRLKFAQSDASIKRLVERAGVCWAPSLDYAVSEGLPAAFWSWIHRLRWSPFNVAVNRRPAFDGLDAQMGTYDADALVLPLLRSQKDLTSFWAVCLRVGLPSPFSTRCRLPLG